MKLMLKKFILSIAFYSFRFGIHGMFKVILSGPCTIQNFQAYDHVLSTQSPKSMQSHNHYYIQTRSFLLHNIEFSLEILYPKYS